MGVKVSGLLQLRLQDFDSTIGSGKRSSSSGIPVADWAVYCVLYTLVPGSRALTASRTKAISDPCQSFRVGATTRFSLTSLGYFSHGGDDLEYWRF